MKKKIVSVMLTAAMTVGMMTTGSLNMVAAEEANSDEEAITATLTVWGPSEDQAEENGQWLQTMCDQFNEAHPNWDLTFEYGVCPEGEAKATVTQDVEGAADVYMFANDNLPDLVSSNAISRLGGDTEAAIKETNSQEIVDSVSIDGAVYGVPFTTNTWFMYYDKSVFSDDDVKSLDTMLEKGKVSFKLTDSWYIASFYVANGCTLFGEDGTDEAAGVDFSGDKGTQVTDYLVDLVANPNFTNDADGSGLSGLRDGSINAVFWILGCSSSKRSTWRQLWRSSSSNRYYQRRRETAEILCRIQSNRCKPELRIPTGCCSSCKLPWKRRCTESSL